jgi:hypothetical protein
VCKSSVPFRIIPCVGALGFVEGGATCQYPNSLTGMAHCDELQADRDGCERQ